MRTISYSGGGVGLGLYRGPGGGGGSCLIFCAVAGVISRMMAKINRTGALSTSAGASVFLILIGRINQLLMPPAGIFVLAKSIAGRPLTA
jgi:hypothetical protein